jgi:hypothetical protein
MVCKFWGTGHMKLVIEDQLYKDIVYQIGLFTIILNQIEYIISKICLFDEKK